MYNIKLIEFPSEEIIKKAIEMDHAAFSRSDWITEEDAYRIYSNKSDCLIWLVKGDEPVGLATIFPLNENIPGEAARQRKPIYKLLTQDVMNDADVGVLYCHCFLLLPEYRGLGLIYHLYAGLKKWLQEKGVEYSTMYADAVSEDGRRCIERLGFEPMFSLGEDEEGALYIADKQHVLDTIAEMNIQSLAPR